jgi:integrase
VPRAACVIRYEGARGVTWRVKYRDADGRQVMETVGREREGFTRKHAESELRERLVRVERKQYRRPEPVTFRQASKRWMEEVGARKQWSPATSLQYRSILERLNETFGHRRLGDVRPSDVSSFVSKQSGAMAAASVGRDLSILRSIFEWAIGLELVDRNPTRGIARPTVRQRKGHALRPEEVQALARAFTDDQDRVAFLTFVLTGVRRSELQALRWRDVDLTDNNRLRVVDSKTETGERSIALSRRLAEELWRHRQRSPYNRDDDRVFCHEARGSVYRFETFSAALRAAYKRAGLEWPERMRACHDLRVTSITNDAIAGANPVALMTKAGHSNMATTKRYLRLAGVVFEEEAARLEDRLLGEQLSTDSLPDSGDVPESSVTSNDAGMLNPVA